MSGQLGVATERKKELTLILPAYRLCTAAGAGTVKVRGRVQAQEAHEQPAEHHCYMYEYHKVAAVVVPFILRYSYSGGSMILIHATVVLQIGATSCSSLLLQYVCLHRTESRACSRCLLVYPRSASTKILQFSHRIYEFSAYLFFFYV